MPKVKLTAKERKAGLDLRDMVIVPVIGAGARRMLGGAAMLIPKSAFKKPRKKSVKRKPRKAKKHA